MPHGAGCSVTPLSPIPSVRVIVLALIAALLAASVLIPASGAWLACLRSHCRRRARRTISGVTKGAPDDPQDPSAT